MSFRNGLTNLRNAAREAFPAWFAFTFGHAVLLQAALQLLRVATSYRALELGASGVALGAVAGSYAILPTVLSVSLGRIIDKRGERIPFRAGAVMMLVAAGGFLLAGTSVPLLIVWSTMLGLGHLLSAAGEHSIIARCAPESRRDASFGYYTVAISIGQMVGPLMVAALAGHALIPETGRIFTGGVVLAVLLIITTWPIPVPALVGEPSGATMLQSLSQVVRSRGYAVSVLAGLAIFSAVDLVAIYLPMLGAERGISAAMIGVLIAVRAGASMVSRLFFERLIGLMGRGRLLTLSIALAAASLALVSITSNVPLLVVEMSVAGLALGIGAPLTLSWVTELAPSGMRGSALALRLAANRVAQTVMPVLAGIAATAVGAGGSFAIMAAGLGVTAVATGRFFATAQRKGRTG
jgi:MFS family permease